MIEDIERVDAIKLDDVNNKHLKSWFGKSLSLSINCYDMGTYYLDSTVNFLKEKGITWGSRRKVPPLYNEAVRKLDVPVLRGRRRNDTARVCRIDVVDNVARKNDGIPVTP